MTDIVCSYFMMLKNDWFAFSKKKVLWGEMLFQTNHERNKDLICSWDVDLNILSISLS